MKTTTTLGITAALLIAAYAYSQNPATQPPRSAAETPPMQPLPEQPATSAAAPAAVAPVQIVPVQAAPVEVAPVQAPPTVVAPVQIAPTAAAPIQVPPTVVPPVQAVPAVPPVAGQVVESPLMPEKPVQLGQPATLDPATPPVAAVPAPAPAPVTGGPTSASAPLTNAALSQKNEIRMNFQGTPLTDVLNYLSDAAGFVIVQDTPVSGTVNVISKQPLTAEEAVDLLNSVIYSKGYAVIRNGRILRIVSRTGMAKLDMQVVVGAIPQNIPKKDEVVIQIIPVKYLDAAKLMDNLRPLISADATMTFNESSNAIILTDTQTNIHRMAEIIHALDTSVSSISTVHVFPLKYADAKDFANVLTQLFNTDSSGGNRNAQRGQQGGPGFFQGGRGGAAAGGGAAGAAASGDSEARKAASRVIAVADTQSNSVVVSAPEEYMETITEIVNRLDTSTTDVTETRIFNLVYADCMELSGILNSLYGDTTTTSSNNQNGRNGGRGQAQGGFNPYAPQVVNASGQPSERALQQARVVTVPDPRTNSIIVSASKDTLLQVSLTIGRLDSSDKKKQKPTVIPIKNADPQTLAVILQGMFTTQSAATIQNNGTLINRQTQGASANATNALNTNGTSTGGR